MITCIYDSTQHLNQIAHFTLISKSIAQSLNYEPFGEISIHLLDDPSMQELNLEYRDIDATTDVLSFAYTDNFGAENTGLPVGEIFLSTLRVHEQAIEHGHSDYEEFLRLTIHGIFHILGYDHEEDHDYKEMSEREFMVISRLQKEHLLLLWESHPSTTQIA
jgi:probable rRNA maturation factor